MISRWQTMLYSDHRGYCHFIISYLWCSHKRIPRIKGSFYVTAHIKPFVYGIAYFSGILAGYLIEENDSNLIRKDFMLKTKTQMVYRLSQLFTFAISLLLSLRGVIFPFLPLLSAIESSLFYILLSFMFCYNLLENNIQNGFVNDIFTWKQWAKLRKLLRISYLIHPIIFTIVLEYVPLHNLSNLSTFVSFLISFTIHYIITIFIHNRVEKIMLFGVKKISQFIFKWKYCDSSYVFQLEIILPTKLGVPVVYEMMANVRLLRYEYK